MIRRTNFRASLGRDVGNPDGDASASTRIGATDPRLNRAAAELDAMVHATPAGLVGRLNIMDALAFTPASVAEHEEATSLFDGLHDEATIARIEALVASIMTRETPRLEAHLDALRARDEAELAAAEERRQRHSAALDAHRAPAPVPARRARDDDWGGPPVSICQGCGSRSCRC